MGQTRILLRACSGCCSLCPRVVGCCSSVRWLLFFHSWEGFCFSSRCLSLPDSGFRFGSYGPDEAQQFAAHGSDDFSLVFSFGRQPRVSLVQPVLRFPRDLFGLFRSGLLTFAQPGPNGGRTIITPCRLDHDSSQMRVARFRRLHVLGNGRCFSDFANCCQSAASTTQGITHAEGVPRYGPSRTSDGSGDGHPPVASPLPPIMRPFVARLPLGSTLIASVERQAEAFPKASRSGESSRAFNALLRICSGDIG